MTFFLKWLIFLIKRQSHINNYNIKEIEHKIIYVILCWAFGYFGVHRLYDKKIFSGIIYLLTFGVFGLGVIIDFVIGIIDFVVGLIYVVKCIFDNNN